MSSIQKRILSIEDRADMSRLIAVILKGYTVIPASSKADALRLVTSEKFDLILSDYHLPDGTGFEICLFIRTFDKTTPIIFATSDDSITEAEVLTLGAQAIVRKGPTFVEKLKTAVRNHEFRP